MPALKAQDNQGASRHGPDDSFSSQESSLLRTVTVFLLSNHSFPSRNSTPVFIRGMAPLIILQLRGFRCSNAQA